MNTLMPTPRWLVVELARQLTCSKHLRKACKECFGGAVDRVLESAPQPEAGE